MNMKQLLPKYILAAKAVIYDAKRAAPLLGMLTTKTGAVNAVHAVMSVIEKAKPIPADISQELSVSILMLLLDVAQQVTGEKVAPDLVKQVTQALQAEVAKQKPMQQPQTPQPQPQGLINQGA